MGALHKKHHIFKIKKMILDCIVLHLREITTFLSLSFMHYVLIILEGSFF